MNVLFFMKLEQNTSLSNQVETLHKKYGELFCKCNGIGPIGGFCLKNDSFNVGGNHLWCRHVVQELRRLFHQQSVYDFGADLGWYGKELLSEQKDGYQVTSYLAFDGAENIASIFPDGSIKHLDLSRAVSLPIRDWVLSLEVGEHIPVEFESIFIENLHRHNTK
jgi:hypothetical protein